MKRKIPQFETRGKINFITNDTLQPKTKIQKTFTSPWLNSLVLEVIFSFLPHVDQLSFRLVNQVLSSELNISSGPNQTIRYSFQLMLHLESHIKDLMTTKTSQQVLEYLHGCVLRIYGQLRNYQIIYKDGFEEKSPYDFHLTPDYSNKTHEDEVELFNNGIVCFHHWIAATNINTQGGRCEMRIATNGSKKIRLIQQYCYGPNDRTGSVEQYYRMSYSFDEASPLETVIEFSFIYDNDGEGYGFVNNQQLQEILDVSKLPSEWNSDKMVRFLMRHAGALHVVVELDCAFKTTWSRICSATNSEGEAQPSELEAQSVEEIEGIAFMDKLITTYDRNLTLPQLFNDLNELKECIMHKAANLSPAKCQILPEMEETVKSLEQKMVKRYFGRSAFIHLMEYAEERRLLAFATFRTDNGQEIPLMLCGGFTYEYGNSQVPEIMIKWNEKEVLADDEELVQELMDLLLGEKDTPEDDSSHETEDGSHLLHFFGSLVYILDKVYGIDLTEVSESTASYDDSGLWQDFKQTYFRCF